MLKRTFEKKESRKVIYHIYQQFHWETFDKEFTSFLRNCNGEYENHKENFINAFKETTRKKLKILRVNHEPHYNKYFRKAIMKTVRLKNKANRSKNLVDTDN